MAPVLSGCASAPPAVAPPAPTVSFEQKMAWILRLEDQRALRDPAPPAPPPPPPETQRRGARPVALPPPPPVADLTTLVSDQEARVRRRAALAIGRVGLPAGVAPLLPALQDPEFEVRQMAAFALGLIGDRSAVTPLNAALADVSPIVQGRAAEALGLIGEASAAPAIGQLVASRLTSGQVAQLDPDDLSPTLSPDVEAFRLGIYALVRLKAYEPLASAVLETNGEPKVRWWPVAYALQRIGDGRSAVALRSLLRNSGRYGTAFAARGLGTLKDRQSVDLLVPLIDGRRGGLGVAVQSVRALGLIGDGKANKALIALLQTPNVHPNLRLEIVTALGLLRAQEATDLMLDLMSDPWPAMRSAALRTVSQLDSNLFVTVLSGLDPDAHWSVRAALASTLSTTRPEMGLPKLMELLQDPDQRVIPSVLTALRTLRGQETAPLLLDHLGKSDIAVRAAAALQLGELKARSAVQPLIDAYARGLADPSYSARGAALQALAQIDAPEARDALKRGLNDKDWAVRVKVAELLQAAEPGGNYMEAIRPAPTTRTDAIYAATDLINPSVSPHVYIETEKGTIEIELLVLEAPLTSENFITLARKGFFNGLTIHRVVSDFVIQDGDPRGDGEGGPNYTIRDELNEIPYLRGTVGMALDWRDTGGSQFFVTHSPQPHLDGRYTAFGRVVNGMEVVDQIRQGDVIQRVRVWDGKVMTTP